MDYKDYGNFFIEVYGIKPSAEGVYLLERWISGLRKNEKDENVIDFGLKCAASYLGNCIISCANATWVEEWKIQLNERFNIHMGEQVAQKFFEENYSVLPVFYFALRCSEDNSQLDNLVKQGLDCKKTLAVYFLEGMKGFKFEQWERE
jgi:hypothetical protein